MRTKQEHRVKWPPAECRARTARERLHRVAAFRFLA
jgi:hypothetical protein